MKEVEDGVKVQKQILQRLEAASAILSNRQRDEERKTILGLLPFLNLPKKEFEVKERAIQASLKKERQADDLEIDRLLHWIVVGGGPTGVELVAEMSDFVR
jgi:hypothetical protein